MGVVVSGAIPFVFCVVLRALISHGILETNQFGHAQFYGILMPVFGGLIGIGIMPGDANLIRIVTIFSSIVTSLVAVLVSLSAISSIVGNSEYDYEECNGENVLAGCKVASVYRLSVGLVTFPFAVFLAMGVCEFKCCIGNDQTLKYIVHSAEHIGRCPLERLWLGTRAVILVHGLNEIVFAIIFQALKDHASWFRNIDFAIHLCSGFVRILCYFAFRRQYRRYFIAFLASLSVEDEAKSAASIAGLLGGRSAEESLTLAKERFRSISFAHLSASDFASNRESQNATNTLFDQTIVTMLGSCDVFISHSWSDDGEEKFEAIKSWAIRFKRKYKREPQVWLDKACIDQRNIADDLLCLPIFLAGCDTLLIIAGKTYTERLWCIIEIFTFLKMGGNTERIVVIPIDMDEQQSNKMFETVDVTTSECYKKEDQERLLAIVEKGFGNFTEFNKIIRNVLSQNAFTIQVRHLWSDKNDKSE